jgi:myo-inositol-1(or 4)-monophosphatase
MSAPGAGIDLRPATVLAVEAVKVGLRLAMEREGAGDISSKGGRDLVTATDVAVEDAVRAVLAGALGYPVVGEEAGGDIPTDSPYWLVDPICGTRNFASDIPVFAVNVGLVEAEQVTLSAVGDGSSGDIYCAQQGDGALVMAGEAWSGVGASAQSQVVVVEAFPGQGPRRAGAARFVSELVSADRHDVRCFGSTLSLAYVATGKVAACILFAAPTLHVAAGVCLAREAGATVVDLAGRPWDVSSASIIAAASPELSEELVSLAEATDAAG